MITKYIPGICVFFIGITLNACYSKPDFYFSDGRAGHYHDYNGQWLVINYWAVWCKPCIEEIPHLNALSRAEKQKSSSTITNHPVTVLGLAFDKPTLQLLKQQQQQLGIDFDVMQTADKHLTHAPHQYYGFNYPSALPTTVIINPQGQLHRLLKGPQTAASILAHMGKAADFKIADDTAYDSHP